MSQTTHVSEKGQATIPQHLRERYGIEPGDEVVWIDTGEEIVVRKRTQTGARGILAEGLSEDERQETAEQFAAYIREKRRSEWTVE
jgi:AbrB family looped-hinge helix DNA binding protein